MKKKIVLTALILAMLSGFSAGAQVIDKEANNVVISGNVPYDAIGNGIVTIIIKDGAETVYADEAEIKDGEYFKKFKYNGDIENCTVSVKAGDRDITSDVLTAEYHAEKFSGSLEVVGSDANRFFSEGDTVKLRAKLKNVWDDGKTYKMLAASYDDTGRLIGIKTFEKATDFGEDGKTQVADTESFTVPEGTASIKGFAWSMENKPLLKSSEQKTDEKFFRNGDRVAFIGDSITHIGIYTDVIEHYYQTKNPQNDYYFYNKGISGQEAASIPKRFERDILSDNVNRATLMIGINDIQGRFGSAKSDEERQEAINRAVANGEEVIKDCKEKEIEINIISPCMYDEDESVSQTAVTPMLNEGLKQLSAQLREIAEKHNVPFYDANAIENEIVSGLRNEGVTGEIITSADRVHPTRVGDTLVAYSILKAQGVDGIVAKTQVNAETKAVDVQNAAVTNLNVTENGVSFKYSPKAIPMAYNERYKAAEKFEPAFTQTLNKELLSVSNLAEGSYTVSLNGASIGEYTALQLSEGINIANLDQNPNQAAAKANYDLLMEKNGETSKLRSIALAESFGLTTDDYASDINWAKIESGYANHVYKGYILKYKDLKPQENDIKLKVEELRQKSKQAAQPKEYAISITKN